jgi:hypothetical protein
MRIDKNEDGRIEIALSRRNLLAMLNKVDRADSARRMEKDEEEHGYLVVVCETDEEHYGSREYGPGAVHPLDDPGIEGALDAAP